MAADPRVLAIGASDPAGTAGIQTDLRTMTRVGVDATAVVTALAGPDANVFRHPGRAYATAVREQMAALRDVELRAIKTGILPAVEVVSAVALEIGQLSGVPIVVDVATSGGETGDPADQATLDAVRFDLLPLAEVVTASLPEAEDLAGKSMTPPDAVRALLEMGPGWALIKGASTSSQEWEDLLSDGQKWYALRTARVGISAADAGATFAAALAAGLALGWDVPAAAAAARRHVVAVTGQSPNGDIRSIPPGTDAV